MICALVMAGGRGTRFYPLSTTEKPKQFLSLVDDKTMIQVTVDRIKEIIPIEQIFIATSELYVELTKEQLPELPVENIIVEPIGRNTAPCVVFSAMQIEKKYPNSNMIVLSSDALIQDVSEFINVISSASSFLDKNKQTVVTIGINPTRPEVGYGYIKQADESIEENNYLIKKVEKFVEKPNIEVAKKYLNEGNYLWNAGIFLWSSSYIIELAKKHMNYTYEILSKIGYLTDDDYEDKLFKYYPMVESISIDYAIMEKINTIYVIPGDFGWDDVGTWTALERYLPQDKVNNVYKGTYRTINANNNIIFSTSKEIVLMGINDIFCIESDDMIVIGTKNELANVHTINNKKN